MRAVNSDSPITYDASPGVSVAAGAGERQKYGTDRPDFECRVGKVAKYERQLEKALDGELAREWRTSRTGSKYWRRERLIDANLTHEVTSRKAAEILAALDRPYGSRAHFLRRDYN